MAAKKKARKKVARKKTTRKPGRPTKYSKALAARICAHLAQGKSVRKVCKLKSMPTCSTVFLWLLNHDEFSEQYERATSGRADALVEDMLDIADDLTIHPQHKRYMIDVRKWNAARMKRRYGDKIEHSGDPNNPVHVALPFDFTGKS